MAAQEREGGVGGVASRLTRERVGQCGDLKDSSEAESEVELEIFIWISKILRFNFLYI